MLSYDVIKFKLTYRHSFKSVSGFGGGKEKEDGKNEKERHFVQLCL